MRLSKTQRQLIDAAATRSGRYAIETGSGRGPFGGKVSYGARERAALISLETAGIVRITARTKSIDSARGYAVHSTVLAFELIDA